ncbi:MAG: SIS domain-containing protein, partial [Nitrospinae bacterium]|nr:SIS domain-containing protein [Nitrospinota bacterium]
MNRKNSKIINQYLIEISDTLGRLPVEAIAQVVDVLEEARAKGRCVFLFGNGGSAATASHYQVDFGFFVRYFTKKRMKFRSLTDQVPMITAIGNDHSYEDIFVDQMIDNFKEGDVLVAISASG